MPIISKNQVFVKFAECLEINRSKQPETAKILHFFYFFITNL